VCSRIHDELKLIPVGDIHYFVADQKYVTVVHQKGSDLIDDSLKSLETEFEDRFVRIHRGALVAVDIIEALKKDESGQTRVILRPGIGDDDLVVSRRHVANVRRRLRKG
jgi:two-component system response regulator AlgR